MCSESNDITEPDMGIDDRANAAAERRADELNGLAEGLQARGVPSNLAAQTVDICFRMGYTDCAFDSTQERER